jgi:hypothetical protein
LLGVVVVIGSAVAAPAYEKFFGDTKSQERGLATISAQIETPGDQAKVPVNGVTASGTVGDLPSSTELWLLIKSPENRHYPIRQIKPVNGKWNTQTDQIGGTDTSEKGNLYVIELATVSSELSAQFNVELESNNDYHFTDDQISTGPEVIATRDVIRQ